MKTAEFWHKTEKGKVRCDLCPHHCTLAEGQTGLCKVRGVRDGELRALFYGVISSAHLDPIEKKPLYHFHPGSSIFSIGGWGCNLACVFCQNWTISQETHEGAGPVSPEAIVRKAGGSDSVGIAYTYNEPTVGFEFVRDCAVLARRAGLKNVLVTNGHMELDPAQELLPLIDALNIDIKSMEDAFYRERCRAGIAPVLEFTKLAVKLGCHVEVTNLVIPGLNDRDDLFASLSAWIKANLGEHVPLHLSAYHPDYRLDIPSTPLATLEKAYDICSRDLRYVYMGNTMTAKGQNTHCPGCGEVLVGRRGYSVSVRGIRDGVCAKCGRKTEILM